MKKIQLQNIKCGGCMNTVIKALEKKGATNISLDIRSGELSYEYGGLNSDILNLLLHLGYPEVGSEESKSLKNKAKSYISCVLGKFN